MIKYYTYYNHGGYKDFYIGNQTDSDEVKYFLPLLKVHQAELKEKPNDELAKSVTHQESLPQMIPLSDETLEYNYPSEARILMSHSGYKLLYRKFGMDTCILSIRDIPGKTDTYGRNTPFNFMFLGNSKEDMNKLDALAEKIRCNLSSFERFINSIFENDYVENGLKVNIGKLNSFIENYKEEADINSLTNFSDKTVRLLVISSKGSLNVALREQDIALRNLNICYDMDGNVIYQSINEDYESFARDPQIPDGNSKHPHGKNPSLHAMLNVPKRKDIEKIWEYIYKLEERITFLEKQYNQYEKD